jgi:tRNA threonylcarbamoyl adenosine modification protein (Sua5/YciO/YrdC/YwlC family)
MEIIKFDKKDCLRYLNYAVLNFRKSKTIVLPTDTIYGIHCLAFDRKGMNKICNIKKRDKKKPFIILVSSIAMALRFCAVNKKQKELLKYYWRHNKPTTVILKAKSKFGMADFAIRLPKNDFLIKIIKRLNSPILSTSLNVGGEKNLEILDNINAYFKKYKPDVVFDAGKQIGKPSKIINLTDPENIKIIRK